MKRMAGIPDRMCEVWLTVELQMGNPTGLVPGLLLRRRSIPPTQRALSAFSGSHAPTRVAEREGFSTHRYARHSCLHNSARVLC
jgi:hypothetical protein